MLEHYIGVIEDLSRDLAPRARYRRLLEAIMQVIPCDAVALLQLQGEYLQPLAALGLRPETLGRRFELDRNPRLARILAHRAMVHFEHDCTLPDPYDGLIANGSKELHVHDCMGMSIYIDDRPWGVITLDALGAGRFSDVEPQQLHTAVSLTRAVITAAQRISLLEQQLSRGHDVTAEINREQAARPLIGRSDAMRRLHSDMQAVAATPLAVLLQGETGVGKEIVARHLHLQSDRFDRPFVQVNCAALPEALAEAELFGHTAGAFTGAGRQRSGRFELADGGTLFLDEVGELAQRVQAKLLRAIQEGELQRMGSDEPVRVDVRIIAATNRDLAEEVRCGRFRADLYHRLSVYPLTVPPLRERGADVLELAEYFLERDQSRLNIRKLILTATAKEALGAYHWPGNVRELEHVLSRAALQACKAQDRDCIVQITVGDLGIRASGRQYEEPVREGELSPGEATLSASVDRFKRQLIEQRLQASNGNIAAAARSLGVDRSNLLRLIRRLGIAR